MKTRFILLISALACGACMPDASSPIEPTTAFDYAPAPVRPYLGVRYDLNISYDSIRGSAAQSCALEAMPFVAKPRLTVAWEDSQLRLQTVDLKTNQTTSVSGNLVLNAATGSFKFNSWIPDPNGDHYYDLGGAYQSPGDLRSLSFSGNYRTVGCTVYFTARGSRI